MTKKTHAYDYVTKEPTYERPLFNFPDLSSENGNPFHFWPIIHSKLNELGFKKEARFFGNRMGFMKYSFNEIIQLVSYFLDFSPNNDISHKNNIIDEDNDYVYIKIKKELYHHDKNLKQPFIFKIKDIETFKEMSEEEDFSIKNCYGRTFLNYIDNPILMSNFLEKNETHKWINLIDLDNFNGSYLHSASNLECFALLFKAMSEEDPSLTNRFLFGTDIFDQSGYQVFINLLNQKSFEKESFLNTFSNEETIHTLSQIFVCLQKVNPEEFDFLKNQFYKNEKIISHIQGNELVQQNIDKMFLLVKLENKLTPENFSNNKTIKKQSTNKI